MTDSYFSYYERKEAHSRPLGYETLELPDIVAGELSPDSETGRHLVERIRASFPGLDTCGED